MNERQNGLVCSVLRKRDGKYLDSLLCSKSTKEMVCSNTHRWQSLVSSVCSKYKQVGDSEDPIRKYTSRRLRLCCLKCRMQWPQLGSTQWCWVPNGFCKFPIYAKRCDHVYVGALLVPKTFGGCWRRQWTDEWSYVVPIQWLDQFWQSMDEGCWKVRLGVEDLIDLVCS